MPNLWVSLRRDQLILFNKAVNKKELLEKGLEEEEKKHIFEVSPNQYIPDNILMWYIPTF
jgi:hypothetical protein